MKSLGILLVGVALGCAIGRPSRWGGAERTGENSSTGAADIKAPEMESGSGSAKPVGAGAAALGGDRLEKLTATFANDLPEGDKVELMALMVEIAGLSAKELEAVMESLVERNLGGSSAMGCVAVRWAMLDPKAAVAFAFRHGEFYYDDRVILAMVLELAKVDLPAAQAVLLRLNRSAQAYTGPEFVSLLLKSDPQAALRLARELRSGSLEAQVLSHLAENDPMAAAAELTPGKEWQTPVVKQIAVSLLKRNRAAFEDWCGSLQDPGRRAAARSQVLRTDAETDPVGAAHAAAAWLSAEPEAAGHLQDEGLSEWIVRNWMGNEPHLSEVTAWAAALPEGPLRDEAVSEVGRRWPAEDTMGASAWLASLPAGKGRDNIVSTLVERIRGESPADAFEWARTMGDPSKRYGMLEDILQGWAEKDSAASQAAVESLPAGDRGYLLEMLQEQEKAKAREEK